MHLTFMISYIHVATELFDFKSYCIDYIDACTPVVSENVFHSPWSVCGRFIRC